MGVESVADGAVDPALLSGLEVIGIHPPVPGAHDHQPVLYCRRCPDPATGADLPEALAALKIETVELAVAAADEHP